VPTHYRVYGQYPWILATSHTAVTSSKWDTATTVPMHPIHLPRVWPVSRLLLVVGYSKSKPPPITPTKSMASIQTSPRRGIQQQQCPPAVFHLPRVWPVSRQLLAVGYSNSSAHLQNSTYTESMASIQTPPRSGIQQQQCPPIPPIESMASIQTQWDTATAVPTHSTYREYGQYPDTVRYSNSSALPFHLPRVWPVSRHLLAVGYSNSSAHLFHLPRVWPVSRHLLAVGYSNNSAHPFFWVSFCTNLTEIRSIF
jgi:hypothetical protein